MTTNPLDPLLALSAIADEMRNRKVGHAKRRSPTLCKWADRIDAALASSRPANAREGGVDLESFKAGAKFALHSVAKQDLCFLTDSMQVIAIKRAVQEVKAHVATLTPAPGSDGGL